jgi:acyl carrier protein
VQDDQLYGLLRNHLPETSSGVALKSDDTLVDLGIDSLRLVEFIIDLEDAFQITVPDDEMLQRNFSTVGAVSTMVNRILATK